MSTRYNDGRYHLKSRVTNVREQATDSPVQNVVIDDYPQNILNGKYYVLKCLRYLTLSEFYFFLQYTHDCRSARRWCSGCLNMRARVGKLHEYCFGDYTIRIRRYGITCYVVVDRNMQGCCISENQTSFY